MPRIFLNSGMIFHARETRAFIGSVLKVKLINNRYISLRLSFLICFTATEAQRSLFSSHRHRVDFSVEDN